MKRVSFFIIGSLVGIVLFSCASVQSQGKFYFLDRTESELIDYFGYSGTVVPIDDSGVYDKVLFFTNRVDTRVMSKTTTTTYKTTSNQNIYSLNYAECNDGCLINYESGYFHYRTGSYMAGYGGVSIQTSPPEHRNDNAFVRAEINRFNSEIRRLNAVRSDDQKTAIERTPVGSWYFVYRVDQEYALRNYFPHDGENIPSSETLAVYHCNIWRVNVNPDNRSSTETYIAYKFDDRSQQYYNEDLNVISETQANNNEAYYTEMGFVAGTQISGLSLTAFITNGKVVKVE